MDRKNYPSGGFLLLAIGLASGCASPNSASITTPGAVSDGALEMVVLNRSADAISVFTVWEGGARIWLGKLRGGQNRTFIAPYRGREVWLSLDVLASAGGVQFAGRDDPQQEFVPVAPGDRVEWQIHSTSPVDLFYRLLPSN
jgi:hypothetical protein